VGTAVAVGRGAAVGWAVAVGDCVAVPDADACAWLDPEVPLGVLAEAECTPTHTPMAPTTSVPTTAWVTRLLRFAIDATPPHSSSMS
jgi:hypothetical protein